ncbi:MAG: uroporphyrinogen-III C-methyltransferase [Candidatus Thiodiazotropha sp. (ex Gloverina cf. vestifex)]|nr:uroporphyrinogen-III C-methyltransferase [Candidatus Thiodiazotropha sp. (ex Gloverina cf. vestifex)]
MSEKEQNGQDADDKPADFEDAIEGEVEVITDADSRKTSQHLPLILAVVAVIATLLFGYRYWADMKNTLVDLDTALQQANREQIELAQQLQQAQHDAAEQKKQIVEQGAALADQHQKLLEAMAASKQAGDQFYRSLSEIQTRLGGKESQWRVAEAEYLLRVANHRLSLMTDPSTALEALKSTDERLGATGDPGWAPVRELVAQEITQLTALSRVDVAGISAQLAALSSQVEKLPLRDEGVSMVTAQAGSGEVPELAADDDFSLQQVLDDFWQGFKSMMVIRHHDRPISAMLPPEQRYFLLQNLRLKLEAAKAALMGRNQALYADNLHSAAEWIGIYFESGDPAVVGFREQLEGLSKQEIAPVLPDISASLRALQARRRSITQEGGR